MARYLVGVDVGGTFTDFVAYDRDSGAISVWKNLSTPEDPTDGILQGLHRIEDPAAISHLRLGTTVATNAILERKGARVAYLATRGFRDVPFIQRGNRRSHYDISWIKPAPLVKHRDCYELDERIDRDGVVLQPLDEGGLRRLVRELKTAGEVEAIAVCLLFSFVEPKHERRVAAIIAEEWPEVPVSISYDVLPRWKEYERASTTIADAYLKPMVGPYLTAMQRRLHDAGFTASAVVIKSNGGEETLAAAAGAPINLAVSGPSGGVIGARHLAALAGIDRLVTFDMGGTSTDCSTVIGGQVAFTTDFEIEWGLPIQVPMIDIRTIGAGGGSIAWIDKGGLLRVGPQSAGAMPGPACYGRGGTAATVTDANVVLGRIDPGFFLGGAMKLDAAAARAAVETVAEAIGKDAEETALAIVRIANNNMVGAIRAVLIERGLDPRDFTLLAFGGAGPPHLADLMIEAGIPRGLVPNHPGQFSAYGFVVTDARVDRHRTLQMSSPRFDPERADAVFAELVAQALEDLAAQGHREGVTLSKALEMRYLGQNYELIVPVPFPRLDAETAPGLWQAFHDLHQGRFGFHMPDSTIEIINFMVTGTAAGEKAKLPELAQANGAPQAASRRRVVFEQGGLEVPVYLRDSLLDGHRIDGPAVIEEAASVTIVRPDQRVAVDRWGNLLMAQK
ncbi:MAG: hydantoinase/oxoprolinase family protein [Alphaproteobacteria bacterium]